MNPEKIFSQATILTEDFAGMKSQAIGLVERAGLKYDLCHLVPKKPWSWISAPYWFSPLRAVQPFHIEANQLHVSVGSVGGAVNAALRSKGSPAIHIQNPRISINKFDLVIVNPHDRLSGDNVIVSRTALHRITPEILFQSKIKWSAFFENFPKLLVAVLLGGNNGRFTLGKSEAVQIANQLADMIKTQKIGIVITPSRRTDPEVTKIFDHILSPLGGYIWNGKGENPYMGFLACADFILVTTDSVSMISEAVATSAPVMIIPLPGKSKRISSFVQSMQNLDRVRLFKGKLENWPVQPIDDTPKIVTALQERFNLYSEKTPK